MTHVVEQARVWENTRFASGANVCYDMYLRDSRLAGRETGLQ